jgi:hypothetical protein
MKLLLASALLFSASCIAAEPPPLAAPNYRIALPDSVEKVRPLDGLPKAENAWEQAFIQCLATIDDRARMARMLELVAAAESEQFPFGVSAMLKLDELGLFGTAAAERDLFWEQYGRLARQKAFEEAQKLASKDASRYAAFPRKAMRGWAESAPEEARKWVDENPSATNGDPLLLRPLIVGWASSDLKAATAYFVERAKPTSRDFQDTLTGLRDFVATRSFTAGLVEWFHTLPDQETEPSVKSFTLNLVLQRVEAASHLEGAKFLDSIKNPKLVTEVLLTRYAGSWSSRGKPQDALEWVLSRPKDDKGTRAGISAVAQVWAGKDAKGFAQWLLANREHESLDLILLGFVKYLSVRDIAEAKRWAKEIKSDAVRKEAEDLL